MGKGVKNQQQEQAIEVNSESYQDQMIDSQEMDMMNAPMDQNDQVLLERINAEISIVENAGLKLTWSAIHALKQQEKQINQQLEVEIQKLQQKYDLLKRPIVEKIAKVACGVAVEKQLYTKHEQTKDISINKNKPQAIPQFWKQVLESVDFCICEQDSKLMSACTDLQCTFDIKEQGQNMIENIKVTFTFSQNEVLAAGSYTIQIECKNEQFSVKNRTPVTFKINLDNSTFEELFDAQTTPQRLFSMCEDLTRAYNSSIYYYFNDVSGQDQQDLQGQDSQDQEDEQQSDDIKPVKKSKKPVVQKPDCKQQ